MKVFELKDYQHSFFSLSLLYWTAWVKLIAPFAHVTPCEKDLTMSEIGQEHVLLIDISRRKNYTDCTPPSLLRSCFLGCHATLTTRDIPKWLLKRLHTEGHLKRTSSWISDSIEMFSACNQWAVCFSGLAVSCSHPSLPHGHLMWTYTSRSITTSSLLRT